MSRVSVASIRHHFADLTDPRRRKPSHPLWTCEDLCRLRKGHSDAKQKGDIVRNSLVPRH